MGANFKIRSTVDPLLATRVEPKNAKRFDLRVLAVAVVFALAAFGLGSWWIRSIIDAF